MALQVFQSALIEMIAVQMGGEDIFDLGNLHAKAFHGIGNTGTRIDENNVIDQRAAVSAITLQLSVLCLIVGGTGAQKQKLHIK